MKLTIFAATGGIGRQALEQAVAAGHDVTAVVRIRASCPERYGSSQPTWRLRTRRRSSALWKELMQCCPALARGRVRRRNRLAGHAGHR